MATITQLHDGNFDEAIEEGITLVDFWAPWCAPCLMQEPIMEQMADRAGDEIRVAKVNVDEAPGVALRLEISAIPTVIVFKDGSPIHRFRGVTMEDDLLFAIQNVQ